MTGGSPGSGPPADAEVDAGWDALLGDAPAAPAAATVLPAALLPPPVILPSTPGPAAQPLPADLLALTDEAPVPSPTAPRVEATPPVAPVEVAPARLSEAPAPAVESAAIQIAPVGVPPAEAQIAAGPVAGDVGGPAGAVPATLEIAPAAPATRADPSAPAAEQIAPPGPPTASATAAAVGETTPPTPLEPSPVAPESAERAERVVAASGRLGAAVVEDDELGAARSGRRVRVTSRVSQRADEPAATSGSIHIGELAEDAAEPREHAPSRPKVAVRAAATAAPRAPAVSPSADGASTGTAGWGWIGLVVIGAVIVGGLFFVQASMRGRADPSGANATRSQSGAKGSAAKKSPKTSAARDGRDGSDTSGKTPSSGTAASSGKAPAPQEAQDTGEDPSGDARDDPGTETPPTAIDAVPPGTEPQPAVNPPDDAGAAVPAPDDSASDARPRDGNPRAIPEGTSPEAAAAFKKIGVSAGDGPPIGAIGASGIHVDDITIGDEWASSRCGGETSKFSIAADKPVNVCLRIVHQREEEQLGVAWQQNGRTVRRSKIKVPDLHAYRTRAYLALRKEYVGQWTVRITSADGAELASVSFDVVE